MCHGVGLYHGVCVCVCACVCVSVCVCVCVFVRVITNNNSLTAAIIPFPSRTRNKALRYIHCEKSCI